jgi:hypothetical protein
MSTCDSGVISVEGIFLKSVRAAPKLRVGLLFSPGNLAAPSASIIEHLLACDFVDLVAVIVAGRSPVAQAPSGEGALYRLYRWLDHAASATMARTLAPRDCAAPLSGLQPFDVDSDPEAAALVPSASQFDALATCRLDVILTLGSVPASAVLAKVARFGVWTGRLGDPLLGDERPLIFWNTIQGSAPLGVSLEAHIAGRPTPFTLASATLSLEHRFSTLRNLNGPAHVGVGLIVSKLWQLHTSGWDCVLAKCSDGAAYAASASTVPTNWQMLAWLSKKSVRHLRHRIRLRNTREIWRVGIRRESRLEGLRAAQATEDLVWIDAPAGHYYADPFVVAHSGRTYLFVEDFDLDGHKGKLVCLEIDGNGSPGPAQTVLERPYHLSYPQVFAHDGEVFMIPESGMNNTVELYRAIAFPAQWALVRVLFRGPAFDTTVLHHDGRFWFFVTLIDHRFQQRAGLLMLYYSDSLLGEWTLHPASPISRDLRFTRCAGSPFIDRGAWIRPTQDCSIAYGGALKYQRILTIDTQNYREEPAGMLTSQFIPGASGIHTYNRDGHLEVIDAKSRVALREFAMNGALHVTR